ncbi:uncharacterized protein LOC133206142 [Saccostrea echinata]|uniref:uncharacterized protein LOC133206142 n=1 Tax=Saccostrea echinata TaxID=191078 RepID=UPI002A80A8C3|nr:uncharacterized protein LOC133206142 [Saccostrea echinata]XP_061198058.1 uncharacterized protein LOC133206142 [Saccostrea echinata]
MGLPVTMMLFLIFVSVERVNGPSECKGFLVKQVFYIPDSLEEYRTNCTSTCSELEPHLVVTEWGNQTWIGCFKNIEVAGYCVEYNSGLALGTLQEHTYGYCKDYDVPCPGKYNSRDSIKYRDCFYKNGGIPSSESSYRHQQTLEEELEACIGKQEAKNGEDPKISGKGNQNTKNTQCTENSTVNYIVISILSIMLTTAIIIIIVILMKRKEPSHACKNYEEGKATTDEELSNLNQNLGEAADEYHSLHIPPTSSSTSIQVGSPQYCTEPNDDIGHLSVDLKDDSGEPDNQIPVNETIEASPDN